MATVASPDRERFRVLYKGNHRRIRRLMVRVAGRENADDLTQVVFAKAAEGLPAFRRESEESTWLYRIATNVASDWLRSRAAREAKATVPLPDAPDEEMSAVTGAEPVPSPEQELSRKDMHDCIREEIAKLPDVHRDVLMLSALGGLSDEELAQTLGISQSNAKVRLHRARHAFRKIIETRCDFYQNELSCKPSTPECCAASAASDDSKAA
jgi:RNA polymerase sigma-70 factor (ECF subfamily)